MSAPPSATDPGSIGMQAADQSLSRENASVAASGLVTVRTPQNAYAYNPRNLAIAYGLGIVASTAIVIVGLICIHAAEGSFSSSFSTILRMTRGSQLDGLVPASETQGKDPLPAHLARTKILLRQRPGKNEDVLTSFVVEGGKDVEVLGSRDDQRQTSHQGSSRDASGVSLLSEHDPSNHAR